jgi:hypothetical protein
MANFLFTSPLRIIIPPMLHTSSYITTDHNEDTRELGIIDISAVIKTSKKENGYNIWKKN